MRPFDFIILFFSFGYALALTQLLFAAAKMVRHRDVLVFSWAHFLWMLAALCQLLANWIELWDFHGTASIPIGVVGIGFSIVVVIYFICALVAPDFDDGDTYDLKDFHARQGRTYIGAFLVLLVQSLLVNFLAGAGAGIQNWAKQNLVVLVLILLALLALFVKARWVQIACPLAIILVVLVVVPLFYPVLA